MTTTKKLVVAVVALSLALVTVVGATLAFLLAESNVVTNTFTYGKITIELTEDLKQDKDGLEYSNVVPGDALDKDPTVTVLKDSEECYVYVLIDNQLGDAATYDIGSEWIKVDESGTKVLYRYNEIVDATGANKDLDVFTTLTFDGDLDVSGVADLTGKNVVIKAFAHQATNLGDNPVGVADDEAIAWAANN